MVSKLVKELFYELYDVGEVKQFNKRLIEKFGEDEDEYKDIAYQLYGYALQGKEIGELVEYLENNQVHFNTVCFSEYKKQQEEHDKYTTNPFDIEKDGLIKCRYCGSYRTITQLRQTRGGDESMTNFVSCTKCGKTFAIAG